MSDVSHREKVIVRTDSYPRLAQSPRVRRRVLGGGDSDAWVLRDQAGNAALLTDYLAPIANLFSRSSPQKLAPVTAYSQY